MVHRYFRDTYKYDVLVVEAYSEKWDYLILFDNTPNIETIIVMRWSLFL